MPRLFLALLLALMATPAKAAWHEARTKHFIIYSEQKPDELRNYAERLERFDAAVRTARRMTDTPLTDGGKLTIYVLPSMSAVEKMVRPGVAGFYIGRAGGSIAVVSRETIGRGSVREVRPEQIFFHEYTHHLMLADLKSALPAWIIEGFAEFFATATIQPDGSVLFGAVPQEHGAILLRDLGFSARDLLSGRRPNEGVDRASIYAKGWLLTHFLTFEPSRSGQLNRYLAAINDGRPAGQAASEAFGDLRKLDGELDRYAASRSLKAFTVAAIPTPSVNIRALSAGESAIMPIRIRSDRGASGKRSDAILADARRVAAAHPDDAFVQGVLAEAEFDVRNYTAAIAAADRALAVDPEQVQALTYKGRALMELGRANPAKADWPAVRRHFVAANRSDTENAEPLWLYHESFKAAGAKPSASAAKGLLYAHALAPQDRRLRVEAVRQLLTDGDLPGARRAFAPLVYDPHLREERRPFLQAVMQRIEDRDQAGALVALAMADGPPPVSSE